MLIGCVLVFAIYVKIIPDLPRSAPDNPNLHSHVWLDSDQKSDTHLKLGPAFYLLAFLLQFVAALVLNGPRQQICFAAKQSHDIFAESWHWFRPPPAL